jgi:WD40 repeat protein
MNTRRTFPLLLAASLLTLPIIAQPPRSEGSRPLIAPFATIQGKAFTALQMGPGNTFRILKTPPDFELNTSALSPDGHLLAMGWGSGRIEVWNVPTKKKLSEFKSDVGGVQVLLFNAEGNQLVVTGSGGKIAFFDLLSKKRLREWTIPLGKYKYDLQELVLDPRGKWLAYADEESGKVLDLTAASPSVLADLKDAYGISLSPDGSQLWTVNRSQLASLNTSNWQEHGRWPLKREPVNTSRVVVRAGSSPDGVPFATVPSVKGLVVYREPEMTGEYVTDKPTSAVAFAKATNTLIDVSFALTFVNFTGAAPCRRSYEGRRDYAVSDDGRWFSILKTNSVDVWRMDDLLRDCTVAP